MEIGFSLGSNLGDRLANLVEARRLLTATEGLAVLVSAPVYETEPVGVSEEHAHKPFLNTVVIASCALELETVAARVHAIEDGLGRIRNADRNAPRTIDIDVIYATGDRGGTPLLDIPHPRWAERRFVVEPLAAVRPDLTIGPDDRTVSDVLLSLSSEPQVVLSQHEW